MWLADDSAAGEKITQLHKWYKQLVTEGKKHGYNVNGGKSWLIVKSEEKSKEAK